MDEHLLGGAGGESSAGNDSDGAGSGYRRIGGQLGGDHDRADLTGARSGEACGRDRHCWAGGYPGDGSGNGGQVLVATVGAVAGGFELQGGTVGDGLA